MNTLETNQVAGMTYYISGKVNGEFVEARAVVTKTGKLRSLLGLGSIEFKTSIVEKLHSEGIVNDIVLKLSQGGK